MRTNRKRATSRPFKGNQNLSSVFGSSDFGPQLEASFFGGTAPFVFGGAQASTSTIGIPSAPGLGSNSPAFYSGTGQKPTARFCCFESTPRPANLFGSTVFEQSQPVSGSTSVGSNSPVFGSTAPLFGVTSFGTMPVFCATASPAFGGASTTAFGASSAPTFGASTSSDFGGASTPFGATSSSLFESSTPAFGQTNSAFGNTSSPSFCSTAMFGSGGAATPFGAQNTPAFVGSLRNGSFVSQRSGTRATSYAATNDAEAAARGEIGKIISITAMPTYKTKSFEELQWEDYQADKKDAWDPFSKGELKQMMDTMNRLFLDDIAPARARGGATMAAGIRAPWDVTEDEEGFYTRVDMPGFSKEDVKVAVEGGVLVVTGHRDPSKEHPRWAAKSYRKLNTRLALPVDVCCDKISAELKNGVLFVTFPKLRPNYQKQVFDVPVA